MTRRQIIKKLEAYLPLEMTIYLSLSMSTPGSIQFCLAVTRIVDDYNSTEENENEVCYLIGLLGRIHFKTVERKGLK